MEVKFPRTLYKRADIEDETAFKWGKWKTGSPKQGGAYHSLIVEDEKELKAAVEMGYIDDFETALLGETAEEKDDGLQEEEF
jgi:hypothetical protein